MVLASVIIGVKIAGIAGAVFSVPIAAVLSSFFFFYLDRYRPVPSPVELTPPEPEPPPGPTAIAVGASTAEGPERSSPKPSG